MTISELAAEMNVTEADVRGFISALKVWISKGYTFEEAVQKHMNQMNRLAKHADFVASDLAAKWSGETARQRVGGTFGS